MYERCPLCTADKLCFVAYSPRLPKAGKLVRILKYTITAALLYALAAGFAQSYSASHAGGSGRCDWNLWRGPDRDGISRETGWDTGFINKPLKIKWKINVGLGYSGVAVCGKYIYTAGFDKVHGQNIIICLEAESGSAVWRYRYDTTALKQWSDHAKNAMSADFKGTKSTPVVDRDRLYFFGQLGDFHCLDAVSGSLIWRKQLMLELKAFSPTYSFASSPVIEGDMVVINARKAGVALNKYTGAVIWDSGDGIANYSSASVYEAGGKKRFAVAGQKELFGVEAESGRILWSYAWRGGDYVLGSDAVPVKGGLYITTNSKLGAALLDVSKDRPVTIWRNNSIRSQYTTPVISGDYIYGIDDYDLTRCTLRCVGLRDGLVKWEKFIETPANYTFTAGYLIIIKERGDLYLVKAGPEKYAEAGNKKNIMNKSCLTAPVLCNGAVYIRNSRGDLIAIDVSKNRSLGVGDYFAFILNRLRTAMNFIWNLLSSLLKKLLSAFAGIY